MGLLNQQEKHQLVADYARPYGVLVETGLWNGGGASTSLAGGLECWAVDLDPRNAQRASQAGVRVLTGDSALVLPRVLRALDRPACFWLDAHLIPSDPHWGSVPCPLLAELREIVWWEHGPGSTVLIDDFRILGEPGYPSWQEVDAFGLNWPGRTLMDDILRFTPRI